MAIYADVKQSALEIGTSLFVFFFLLFFFFMVVANSNAIGYSYIVANGSSCYIFTRIKAGFVATWKASCGKP